MAPSLAWCEELLLPEFAGLEWAPEESFDLASAMDKGHAGISRRVAKLGRQIDRLFGGDRYTGEAMNTEARVSLTTLLSDEEVSFDTRLRLRLALPNTEQRLSVIFESLEDDLFNPSQVTDPAQFRRRPGEGDDDYFAGLRYIRRFADLINLEADAGAKVRFPLDPYLRVQGAGSWYPGAWEARLSQSLFWRNSAGAGATAELLLQRELRGPQLLQAFSSATYLERRQRFFYLQDVVISHEFNDLNALRFHIGARAESEPNHRITSYFVTVPWRRNIYREWLFIELRPELLYERSDDFRPQPRLFITLEAFFGEKRVAPRWRREPEPFPPPSTETALGQVTEQDMRI